MINKHMEGIKKLPEAIIPNFLCRWSPEEFE
jgi:hypothetical protein